jgi:hypothetical protein
MDAEEDASCTGERRNAVVTCVFLKKIAIPRPLEGAQGNIIFFGGKPQTTVFDKL